MLKKISMIILVTFIALLLYATTRPGHFAIERSISITASPETLFSIVNSYQDWDKWSPWEKIDPSMKKSYSGPVSGKGAISTWDGNNEVGAGRSEIIESVPFSKVIMRLDMIKPFEAHNSVTFTLKPELNHTTLVTWNMQGEQPYLGKVMSIFMDCDKLVGKEFEEGLHNLKQFAEKQQK